MNKLPLLLVVALVLVGAVGVGAVDGRCGIRHRCIAPPATYTTQSPPDSSQWLVLRDSTVPISVERNGTSLTHYPTLGSLDNTTIGQVCQAVDVGGACLGFVFVDQQGWSWSNQTLYVHYEGGDGVVISVRP